MEQVILREAASGAWLVFRQPQQILQARKLGEVLPVLRQVQEAADQRGLWAVGFLSYEAAPAFDAVLRVRPPGDFPLAWFGLFSPPERVNRLEDAAHSHNTSAVDANSRQATPGKLTQPGGTGTAEPVSWTPSVDRQTYDAAITSVKEAIVRGDTYQVNYTMRLNAPFQEDAWALFLRLAHAQQAQYSAFVETGRFVLCSASPELFFRLDGEKLLAKPMKGTAGRGRWLAEDDAQAEWLQNSEKNRAENVMIVDMLRNDMGRVAQIGSVQVPRLFEVERYPTVWQMTSTVTAQTALPFSEIMAALFPCASITGAPKASTMQIIARLETTPRRVYTGCIGFYAPNRQAQFNVAIRTVIVDRQNGQAEYGVGGGIVWDSTSAGEYDECLIKTRVLTEDRPSFSLIESLLWEPQSGYFLLERHLQRLEDAARYFGFALDGVQARSRLLALVVTLPPWPHKVRLLVAEDGALTCQAAPLDSPAPARQMRLGLAAQPVDTGNVFLYHKTTVRKVYEMALAACPDCDDVLLWNERGELTETCTANLIVKIGDELFTPPVACGLLPGTMRAHLLEQGLVKERVVYKGELGMCEHIYVVNSVRGMREAGFL